MDCRKAQKDIFSWLDEELPARHAAELAAHIASCPACRKEAEFWRAVTRALKDLPAARPPEGFAAGVMARIRAEDDARPARARTSWWQVLPLTVRRGAVAAAAALLLLAGAVGLAARHWWPADTLPQVAVNAEQSSTGATGVESPAPPGTDNSSTSGTPEHEVTWQEKTAVPTTKSGGQPSGVTASPPEKKEVSSAPQGGEAQGSKAPLVFLNQPRAIESTLIKVQVADLTAAQKGLLALAGSYERQGFGRQQVEGRTVEIWRFVVPAEKAEAFINATGNLGRVTKRQDQSDDITARFAQALERYHSLLAARATAGEAERASLEAEISFLEQQLLNWDKEAKQHVVVVLLEGK